MRDNKQPRKTRQPATRQAFVFEELEPRLLLSADLPVDMPVAYAPDGPADEELLQDINALQTETAAQQTASRELVFVDTDTPDYQLLLDDLLNRSDSRQFDVVLLDDSSDGIAQISEALSQYTELDAVHIISHGSEGSVDLGGNRLEFDSLLANASAIQGWSSAFAEHGDLLIYGCNLATSDTGQALVDSLARLTGTDVAASDDLTGNAEPGGDWELEYQTGRVETSVAVSSELRRDWTATLTAPVANDNAYTVNAGSTLTVDWWNSAWSDRQQLTFDNLGQAENLIDFPVLIVLNSGNIDYAKTQNNGADLRFIDADGKELAYEIEEWNESGNSSVWVKVPQITGNSATDSIWMYYDNATAPPAADSAGVWDSNFVGVWHLNEEQTGTGSVDVYNDSTSFGNHGIDRVAASGQEGQIGDGQQFGANDWIEIDHDASLDLKDSMTISFWVKPTSDSGTFNRVVEKGLWGYNDSYYFGGGDGNNDLTFYLNGQEVIDTPDDVLTTVGEWQHAAVSYTSNGDGTGTAKLYLNGVEIATGNYTSGVVPGNTGRLAIGHDDPLYDFDGFIDEVQISNTDRSADWIVAQHKAMTDAFVSFGGEETAPIYSNVLANDTDSDGDSLSVVLVNGPSNAASFTLNQDGSYTYTPNGGFSGIDSFTYKANDGSSDSNTATVTITVNNVPVITSNGGSATANVNVAENTTAVTTVTATDADLDALTYSITGGSDSALFSIDANSGVLNFNSAPNFEVPADANADNVYEVTVQVSDGKGGTDTQAISVTVTEVLELVVTSTNATGTGSLHEAILNANANTGVTDTITFNIPGGGPHVINLTGALPAITDAVIIDGTTDPDYAGTPLIVLDGSGAGSASGFTLNADNSTIRGLVINGFAQNGILVNGNGNTIVGNWIGVDPTGLLDSGNGLDGIQINGDNNIIGGSVPADRNVISGNNDEGIDINAGATGTIIQGNYVGTNASGTAAIPNGAGGIGNWGGILVGGDNTTVGGSKPGEGNLISGNHSWGIIVESNNSIIQGNLIGTAADGTTALGNTGHGLVAHDYGGGLNNLIGGTVPGAGNVIANNRLDGIAATGNVSATFLGNIILNNSGMGIDLGDDGMSANDSGDADSGSNALQNFPVITSAELSGTDLTLGGSLDTDSLNTQYRIEFYGNAAGTQNATNGEGRIYLGSVTVTTDGSGDAAFTNITLSGVTLVTGDYVTATATRIIDPAQVGIDDSLAYGSTSEFSTNVAMVAGNAVPTTTGIADVTVDEDDPNTVIDLFAAFADAEDADASLVYTITGNTNAGLFSTTTIDGVAGTLTLDYASDTHGTTDITVRATDTGGQWVESTFTVTVSPVNDAPTGSVTIDNMNPIEGDTLTASNTLADADGLSGSITYQWYRSGAAIGGATASSYTTVQADVGIVITVVASYTDDQGTNESVTSAGTAAVTNVNDAPTGSVTISGTPTEDQVLTAAHTLADEDGLGTIGYQWQRDGVDIGGATSSTYTLTQADVGATITVVASYMDGQGSNESVTSAGVGPIANSNNAPTGTVTISGSPTEDQTLTVSNTLADIDGMGVVTYQWQCDGVDITGATGSTYVLGDADVGSIITVVASYTDGLGASESMSSAGLGPIANVNDVPVARPDGVYGSFDGDDFIHVADHASLQMSNNVTMEAWINHDGTGTGTQIIVNKEGEYELAITAETGEIKWALANTGPTWSWYNTGNYITAGEWTHVAVTYDGIAGEARTYINGELIDTAARAGAIGDVYPSYNDLFIGGRENAVTQRFQGQINEVRVWNSTRTQAEIQTTMDGLLTGGEPGLAGYWRLAEASGGVAIDKSPFGNDGTLGGLEGAAATPTYQGYFTNEDSVLTVPAVSGVLANDFDIDGDTLTVTNLDTTGMLGSLVLNPADGSFTYDPRGVIESLDDGEHVTETFTYTANDGSSDSNTVTVTITVTGANDAPTVSTVAMSGNEDTAIAFAAADFNAAFSDVDADSLTQIQVTSLPANGTLQLSGVAVNVNDIIAVDQLGNLSFTPNAHWNGSTSFTWLGHDGTTWTAAGSTVDLTVNPVNDAPISGMPSGQTTSVNTPLVFSSLDGNSISVADPDGTGATLEVTLNASNGALSLANTTGLVFTVGNGTNDTTMTFTGNATAINAALEGLLFQPDADFQGFATLQLVTDDLGNSGAGGALNTVDSIGISVVANASIPANLPPPLDELIEDSSDLSALDLDPVPSAPTVVAAQASTVRQEGNSTTEAGHVDFTGSSGAVTESTLKNLPASGDVRVFETIAPAADNGQQNQTDARAITTRIWNALTDPLVSVQTLSTPPPGSLIWNFIDLMTDQISTNNSATTDSKVYVLGTTATGVTFAFSAGYVSWLLRAGYLSAALLSSAPLWRQLDPLPILPHSEENKRKKDKDGQDSTKSHDKEVERIFEPGANGNFHEAG